MISYAVLRLYIESRSLHQGKLSSRGISDKEGNERVNSNGSHRQNQRRVLLPKDPQ